MKILHYSLGFPPYRTGGLTKFCMDLIKQQVQDGHEVSLLWPGEIKLVNHKTMIRSHDSIYDIVGYEVVNPTPVSFDEGIKDFEAFMQLGDANTYEILLTHIQPDVIHIHTLMGLHKSFLDVAKKKGIRLVFTTHDFFPICPKVTMFRDGKICEHIESCEQCGVCNNTALSIRKIQILQSPLYRVFKDCKIVKKLRRHHRDEYLGEHIENSKESVGKAEDYLALRDYFISLLKMMDIIHYNSDVTKKAYERVFVFPNEVTIPISHSDIGDHRRLREYNDGLRIQYMGPRAKGKGFDILNDAVERIWKEGKRVSLDVYFSMENKPKYINCHNRFTTEDLEEIFNDTDVLVCPSVWYETFGFTVLEALSYGVPVVVSDTVGAKDIIADGSGVIIDDIIADKLYETLNGLSAEVLQKMNKSIMDNQKIRTINEVAEEIANKVYLQ